MKRTLLIPLAALLAALTLTACDVNDIVATQGFEYDYEINAETGEIIKSEKEFND